MGSRGEAAKGVERHPPSNVGLNRLKDKPEAILEAELTRFKRFFDMGFQLELSWVPDPYSKLSGEVKRNRIFIYDEGLDKALATLKHEFVDYVLSCLIAPYREVTNMFIKKFINERAYREKEKVVEALVKLL